MLGALLMLGLLGQPAPSDSGPSVALGIFSSKPVVIDAGNVLGGSLAALRSFGGWCGALRARIGFVEENDLSFEVHQTELRTSALFGYMLRLGQGDLGLLASAGTVGVLENRTRHQADRLPASEVDLETSGFELGGIFSLEATARVLLVDRLLLLVDVGPTLALRPDADETTVLGFAVGVSLGYAFGDGPDA